MHLQSSHVLCNRSKSDWPMNDMSINQKKWAEGFSKRNLVRHIVKHGLDWICKTRTGFAKHGFVKHGFVKRGFVKHGFVKHGFVKRGFVKHGFVKRGFVKHGFVKHGFVKGGLSFFVKMIALFDCSFVYFCLSLFNLNSFTLYYFHFMLPLHIQIISLKDCLTLSNISIWKFLRIIEKYEKHSLTASKYSQHFRHSLVFKNKIPRTYI